MPADLEYKTKTYIKKLCENDLVAFSELILDLKLPPYTQRWIDWIEGKHPDTAGKRSVGILGPRESCKSLILGAWMLWKICLNPNIRILLIAEQQALARNL